MTDSNQEHSARILDQFTRQAAPFAQAPAHSTEESLHLFLETVSVSPEDEALDVACGPGIISCALASTAHQVTGIDFVPAMIEEAKKRQSEKKLTNLQWELGDAEHLPFEEESFSLVVTRYSFHHLLHPERVLSEMKRVCRPGGRIAVADVTPAQEKTQGYDELEKMRDPSHVRTYSVDRIKRFGSSLGLGFLRSTSFGLQMPLEDLLNASFPPEGNAERFRRRIQIDMGRNELGFDSYERDGQIMLRIPTSIVVWTR